MRFPHGATVLCIVFGALMLIMHLPAYALIVTSAQVKNGAVEVRGKEAESGAPITWEGQPVTQAGANGRFKFATIALPLDCVGEVSDGTDTISAVVKFCETGICQADVDLSKAQAVGLDALRIRMSGIGLASGSFVEDLRWTGTGLTAGTMTLSAAPTISNLSAQVSTDPAPCGAQFPDIAVLSFEFSDPNGDVAAGDFSARYGIKFCNLPSADPVHGNHVTSLFPNRANGNTIICATADCTSGTISIFECWGNVSQVNLESVRVRDGDEQLSNQLTLQVDLPCTPIPGAAARSGTATRGIGNPNM